MDRAFQDGIVLPVHEEMHNDELREGSREISIWHTKSLTGSNTVEKQRMEKERERYV